MDRNSSLNGSVQLIVDGLQQVVREAVREGVAPVQQDMQVMQRDMKVMQQDMKAVKKDMLVVRHDVHTIRQDMQAMEVRLNGRIDTTNQNMQVQFAEQEKKIARLMRDRANAS